MTCKNHKELDYSCTACCKHAYKERVEEIKKITDPKLCGVKHPEGQECQQCQEANLERVFLLMSSIDPRILNRALMPKGFMYEGSDPEGNSGATTDTDKKPANKKKTKKLKP